MFQMHPKHHYIAEESPIPQNYNADHVNFFQGYWQDIKYFEWLQSYVPYFTIRLQEWPNELVEIRKQIVSIENSVSIHIRRGDYVNHPLYGNICDKAYYQRAITYIKEKTDCYYYIIFSNDIKWCEENLSDLLMGKNVVFVNWNKSKDSYQDMYLMSRCNYNIIANSSFSWWGAWLNYHEDKIVICPTKWNNIKSSKFDLPQSWIKI